MRIKMRKKKISSIMSIVVIILCIMLIINIIVGGISIRFIWNQTNRSISNGMEYFAVELDKKLNEIDNALRTLIVSDREVTNYKYRNNDGISTFRSYCNIVDSLNEIQMLYGKNFQAFLYFEASEELLYSSNGSAAFGTYKEIGKKILSEAVVSVDRNLSKNHWEVVWNDGVCYTMTSFYYDGIYACCYSSMDALEEQVDINSLGTDSIIIFAKDNQILNLSGFQNDKNYFEQKEGEYFIKYKTSLYSKLMHQPLKQGDFELYALVTNQKNMINALLLQLVIAVLIMIVAVCAIFIFYIAKKRVVEPMQYFSENLGRMHEEYEHVYFESSNIQELEEANDLFKHIIEQIKKLKIQVYEQMIEKQGIELDYLHLQIQPHFYVNCLTMISNMAYDGEFERIQSICRIVSEYLRYIFRPSHSKVQLNQELMHIKNYLEICKFRYKKACDYRIEATCETNDVILPPLILQTFVENSVKHSPLSVRKLRIHIGIEKINLDYGQEFVVIEIKDNGPGFSQEVLSQLQEEEPFQTDDGTHIGIFNSVKRLRILYDHKARVTFFNDMLGGAVVRLCIPVRHLDEKEGSEASGSFISG